MDFQSFEDKSEQCSGYLNSFIVQAVNESADPLLKGQLLRACCVFAFSLIWRDRLSLTAPEKWERFFCHIFVISS